jgi:2-polyprenyl-3-methyl-5-hydroxy-6-metoxy-1,4-benzoquinol methylase
MHVFDVNGKAALSDFKTSEWRDIFSTLEQQQDSFLRKEELFRSSSYPWPHDPLHSWSRAWEYPYIYFHLARWRSQWQNSALPRVVDVGSGVTFFPFTVSRLGCEVICTDNDPICETDLRRAISLMSAEPGIVDFRLAKDNRLPFGNHEVDAVYCISVLEHIPDFEQTIAEIARIVRAQGLVLLTIDLDLSGEGELSASRHKDLQACLEMYFEPMALARSVPTFDQLTSRTGPYPLMPCSPAHKVWFRMKQTVKSMFGLQPSRLCDFYLAVEGIALTRSPSAS